MAKTSLVIVESPAKAKTIGKYLGPGYQVKACMGHLRDLPKSTLGVDLEHDFTPNYRPIKGKEDIISDLKKSAKDSQYVYLATDPDREGEAISWHLKELLRLSDDKARRVTFNEITKRVVNESIAAPREIDQDLVDAQQARRILDRIVGYQLSPLLWKKIRRGLSAGRVQSVATRMVCDREKEITEFKPQEYWSLDVKLATGNQGENPFTARYHGENGKKRELNSQEEVDQVVSAQVMLDLSGATSSVNQEFDYILLDGQGNEVSGENITVSSRRIEISAPVYLVKTLELTVDFTESPGSALEDLQDWYLGVTSIEVAGEAANLEGVDDILLATVDLSTLLSDTEMPLEITIPAGCVNISGITSTTLTILFKDTLETRAFTVSNISAIGLSQTQNFSRMTNSVEVLLRGDAQELEQVTADDIRIVVDLTPYEDNGTYSVPAVVLVDGHSNVGAVGTYSVACRITSS